MTNGVALAFALLIAGFLLLDAALGLGAGLFLARRGLQLVEWLAFWR